MKKILTLICSFLIIGLISTFTVNSEKYGLANFNLGGGNRGHIPFPHKRHQIADIECNICHAIFPKHIGSIKTLIDNGTLTKKHVMNKLCIVCHKKNKDIGKSTGPTTCKNCHVK